MYSGLVVADDRTGANDAGNEFATRGLDTEVWGWDEPVDGDPELLVVDTDTRDSSAELAAERVRTAIETHAAGVVYKKIDSTLRGNLVAEIEAALEATGASVALVAPAFPAAGRTTAGGFHLVDGEPVTETVGADGAAEPRSSHLPTRLAGGSIPVEHLSLDVIKEGAEAIDAALADVRDAHDSALLACDATRSRHLGAIGRVAAGGASLCVGSAGLAAHLRLKPRQTGAVVGVVGSLAPETRAQLRAVSDDLVVELEGELAVRDPESAVRNATRALTATLDREGTAVLATGGEPARPEAADDPAAVAEALSEVLGRAVATLCATERVGGLFLTGGDVAGSVLSALDAAGVRLTGHGVDDGVPVGEIIAGPESGTPVVTKAGGFGTDETIVNCLDFLRRYDG